MPLVLSGAPSYCSITDVQNFGVGSSATGDDIAAAIALSSTIINNYTGAVFGQASPSTFTNNDVRKPIVVLPTPFTDVVDVTLDQVEFTTYVIEDWGLRLYQAGYYDPDGFPRWQSDSLTIGSGIDPGIYGSQVAVTATFGYPFVPLPVAQACKMLAARFVKSGASDLLPNPKIKMLQVEDYRIQLSDTDAELHSTGDEMVDRMLSPYVSMKALVG